METHSYDFIVLGSGIAGLRAAIELSAHGDVALLTKSTLGEGSSEHAQGGVAVVMADDDDITLHFDDTIKAGDGLCDHAAVKTLVEEGPDYIRELIAWGAQFDMHGGTLSFTREAAHSVNRIIHAHGDATGHEIVRALKAHVAGIPTIFHVEHMFALDLIVRENRVHGVLTVNEATGALSAYFAKAVVLATGGAGCLFSRTTNPEVATADGMAMAFRAGAEMKDMEFFQFHPTALSFPGAPAFLLSESMRGEGGVLINTVGERFAPRYSDMAELAPRDVVARAIFFEMKRLGARHVYIDMTHLEPDFLTNRFPKIHSTILEYGIDLTVDLVPVAPAAHYSMGGITTDTHGRTSIDGLYACGETACSGVHGANRLASNSLLEGVVFGGRAGKAAAADAKGIGICTVKPDTDGGAPNLNAVDAKKAIRDIMWDHVGLVRTADGLSVAITMLEDILASFTDTLASRRAEAEVRNMATVGLLMAKAALNRAGSRGGHYREDFPERMERDFHITFKGGALEPMVD